MKQKVPLFIFSIALILSSSLPSSMSCETYPDQNCAQDLCTGNFRPEQCLEIIRTNDGFNSDNLGFTYTAINLTRGKACETLDYLNQLHQESDDEELKRKYQICIDNYNDVLVDIDQVTSYLEWFESGSCEYNIADQVHSVLDAFEDCRHAFNETAFDPAHVMDRNKELFVYGQLAMAAAGRLGWLTLQQDKL